MIDLLIRISTLYNIPQWAVNIGAFAIFMILVAFPFVVKKLLEPKYYKFKEMVMYNVLWRWKYKKDDIIGLWCYCPRCGAMLICDDENCKVTEDLQSKITFFVCNDCGGHEQGRVTGGDRRYALSLVKREILRYVRTGEYTNAMKQHKEALEAFRIEKEALEALSAHLNEKMNEDNDIAQENTTVAIQYPLACIYTFPLFKYDKQAVQECQIDEVTQEKTAQEEESAAIEEEEHSQSHGV